MAGMPLFLELDIRLLSVRTLRKQTVVPIAVVSRFFTLPLSGKNPETKATAPLFHNQSVLSAVLTGNVLKY